MSYKLKNIRVLVSESNQSIRMLIRFLLLDLGVGIVDIAATVEQGWDLFCQLKHDLIFVDWPVDDDDALDFVRQVRGDSDSPIPHVSLVMMTSLSNKERVLRARDAGITEFLIKPFTVQNLVRYITHIVENPRAFVQTPRFTGPDRRRRIQPAQEENRTRPMPQPPNKKTKH